MKTEIKPQVVPYASDESLIEHNTSYNSCDCADRDFRKGGSYFCPYEQGQRVCRHVYRVRAEFHAQAQFEATVPTQTEIRQAERCQARSTAADYIPAESPLGRLQAAQAKVQALQEVADSLSPATQAGENAAYDLLDAQLDAFEAQLAADVFADGFTPSEAEAAELETDMLTEALITEMERGNDEPFTEAERAALRSSLPQQRLSVYETRLRQRSLITDHQLSLDGPAEPGPPALAPATAVNAYALNELFKAIQPQLAGSPAGPLRLAS